MKRILSLGAAVALAVASVSFASAQSVNGSVNSGLGGKAAHTGANGQIHSRTNATLNHGTTGSNASLNGTTNSKLGGKAAHTGLNGKIHSKANKAINSTK